MAQQKRNYYFASNHILSKNYHENNVQYENKDSSSNMDENTILEKDLQTENIQTIQSEPQEHFQLYPNNLSLLDIDNFSFILNADICNVKDIALVTIVHSAVGHQVDSSRVWTNI